MWNGVMHVQQIELVREHHLVHPHGQREIVRRIFEERISPDVDLVEVDARQERRQPKWLLVRDEVDLVAAPSERHAELRRHGARAAIGRIASNADSHARRPVASRHQRSTTDWHDGSRGFTRVTNRSSS